MGMTPTRSTAEPIIEFRNFLEDRTMEDGIVRAHRWGTASTQSPHKNIYGKLDTSP